MYKLAIVTTHPIQYYAPVFRLLHLRGNIAVKVFYTVGGNAAGSYDPGFLRYISWDIPLLNDYSFEWVKNTSLDPGSHHFRGIVTPGLVPQLDSWGPHAILVIGWSYQSHLQVLRHYKNKLPVYFRGDSTLLDERRGIRQLFRSFFLKWVYHHVDHAFYVGKLNRAYFKKYGLKDGQLTFAPHAIDNERFRADRAAEVRQFRSDLGLLDHHILILFSGKFTAKKGPDLLLEAFLRNGRPDAHLLFIGNGDAEDNLRDRAAGCKNIHFVPFQNQSRMPVIYQSCDLFCLPSRGPGETWGLAVNEAMACGKAIIVSDRVGCGPDLVSDVNGMVFSAPDIDGLHSALQEMLLSRERLCQLGHTSKNVIQSWNFEELATAIEQQLLRDLTRGDLP